MDTNLNIRPKDRDAIIQSLRMGVVPRTGQQYIQVGRLKEVESLYGDIERISDNGAAFRLIIGEYGAGKTFFLNLIRSIALQKKLVTLHADLTPDRRLQANGGQARNLYAELLRNMATRSKPEGNALASVVERFVTNSMTLAREQNIEVSKVILDKLQSLTEMIGGYDFAQVIQCYYDGYESGNDILTANAIRWLRGEFHTKTDARLALGVRSIIDDASFYDQLKLLAKFVRLAGYDGLLVNLDEMVNLYKITSNQARNANYEQVLRLLNDCLQGATDGIGFLLGGTPEFVTDTRRGLYSYPALQSRLAENSFAINGLIDMSGPVLRLSNLSQEDIYVLLVKLRAVYFSGENETFEFPDDAIHAFMNHCSSHIGEAYFRTPRNTIRSYLDLLSIISQHPEISWEDHLKGCLIEADIVPNIDEIELENSNDRDELASFKI